MICSMKSIEELVYMNVIHPLALSFLYCTHRGKYLNMFDVEFSEMRSDLTSLGSLCGI